MKQSKQRSQVLLPAMKGILFFIIVFAYKVSFALDETILEAFIAHVDYSIKDDTKIRDIPSDLPDDLRMIIDKIKASDSKDRYYKARVFKSWADSTIQEMKGVRSIGKRYSFQVKSQFIEGSEQYACSGHPDSAREKARKQLPKDASANFFYESVPKKHIEMVDSFCMWGACKIPMLVPYGYTCEADVFVEIKGADKTSSLKETVAKAIIKSPETLEDIKNKNDINESSRLQLKEKDLLMENNKPNGSEAASK